MRLSELLMPVWSSPSRAGKFALARRHLAIAVSAALLCGCLEPPQTPFVVTSDLYPDLEIECGGERGLTPQACTSWAESMMDQRLPAAARATRLVMTYRSGHARCAADFYGADGTLLVTVAAVCPQGTDEP